MSCSLSRQVPCAAGVLLVGEAEPTWEKPFIIDHVVAGPSDTTALFAVGRTLAERYDLPVS
ncbi:hypothetical protein ACFV7R_28350 [Streptomyces sp. NPDC059866]|uniref:hypothetical protein n=1 Tax=Streptomyces sp. NPDC059866 TaxID=3346978 RepID=UPI0036564C18